ncbi:MAG: hypothetical protein V4579_13815 [Pseudomonadota bacterium]
MTEIEAFASDYKDHVDDVLQAQFQSFCLRLQDWLDFLDNSPVSKPVMERLENEVAFGEWFNAALATRSGTVGGGRLNWSRDRTERLGQHIFVMRYLAHDEMAFSSFSTGFLWAGTKYNESVAAINDQVVRPFARDLLKHIERGGRAAGGVPAADRIVTLDHNRPDGVALREHLSVIQTTLETSTNNSLKADEEFDRNLAEISAARRLVAAARIRVGPLADLLTSSLKWLLTKVAENLVGVAVAAAITALAGLLAALFGIVIPGLS